MADTDKAAGISCALFNLQELFHVSDSSIEIPVFIAQQPAVIPALVKPRLHLEQGIIVLAGCLGIAGLCSGDGAVIESLS